MEPAQMSKELRYVDRPLEAILDYRSGEKDDAQWQRKRREDLYAKALPLWNSLPTDSTGATCYSLGGNMLFNGFPDGSIVCWGWGLKKDGEPEWRRSDHAQDEASPVFCLASTPDGGLASGCNAGRISYLPANAFEENSLRSSPAQIVKLPFFRGCRVIDKQRIGTVALTAEMSTLKDMFGASFRIRWEGEENLDELSKEYAMTKLRHYFTVSSLVLTTRKQILGGVGDDRPAVIVGTSNGVLLGYCFSDDITNPSPPEQLFVVSPYIVVDLDDAVLNDTAALRKLSLDGPPITALCLSADEPGVLIFATGRQPQDVSSGSIRGDPELVRMDLVKARNSLTPRKTVTPARVLHRSEIGSDEIGSDERIGLRRVPVGAHTIVGFSKAAFYITDGQLWRWKYTEAPERFSDATCLAHTVLDSGEFLLATAHCYKSVRDELPKHEVRVWGTDIVSRSADEGATYKKYEGIHKLEIKSLLFKKDGTASWTLVSAGLDREVHQIRGRTKVRSGPGASPRLSSIDGDIIDPRSRNESGDEAESAWKVTDQGFGQQVRDVVVSQNRCFCCVAVGSVVKVYSFVDIALDRNFKLLAELAGHDDSVNCICMSTRKGIEYVVSGSSDNTALIWQFPGSTLTEGVGTASLATPEKIGPLFSSVTAVCVDRNPRGAKFLFLGLADGSISIFNWNGKKEEMQKLEFHDQPVLSLSTHASKRLVSGGADNLVAIWESTLDSGFVLKEDGVLRQHDGNVNSVYMGHKARKIVTGSTDTNVLFWELEDLSKPRVFKGHNAAVMACCTSHDMQTVISADQSGIIIEWDVISGSIRKSLHASSGETVELNVQDDSRLDAAEVMALHLIDFLPENGANYEQEELSRGEIPSPDTAPQVRQNRLPNGRWLIVAKTDSVQVIRMDSLENTVKKGHTSHVSCVAMSDDSELVVSASWDGTLILWDATEKTQRMTFKGHMGPVFCCDISADKRWMFSGSADTSVIAWDCRHAGRKIRRICHDDLVESLKMMPSMEGDDNVRFVTASMDHKVQLFLFDTCEINILALFSADAMDGLACGLKCVIGARDIYGYVAIGAMNGDVILWKPETLKLPSAPVLQKQMSTVSHMSSVSDIKPDMGSVYTLKYHKDIITSVYYSVDGDRLLATSKDCQASIWSKVWQGCWKLTKTFTHPNDPAVNVGRFSEQASSTDTLLVILGCDDGRIYIWDYATHVIEKVLIEHTGPVCDLEISIDSKVLITAARERRILRWNLVRGTADQQLIGHRDGVLVVEVSHKTRRVVSGAKDNHIIVWNTLGPSAGKKSLDLLVHSGNVSCLSLSEDGAFLLSGSWDTTVCLTNLNTPQVIRTFHGHIGAVLDCCISSGPANELISCCRAGRLIRWDVESGSALWKKNLGSPANCLAYLNHKDGGLIFVGCEKKFAIQVWTSGGVQLPFLMRHESQLSTLELSTDGKTLCSADVKGYLKFWETSDFTPGAKLSLEATELGRVEKENTVDANAVFTYGMMASGIESVSIEDDYLVVSTCEGHVLLFQFDPTVGIVQGSPPLRVWKHHRGRVPCVKLMAPKAAEPTDPKVEPKVVTASYDGNIFVHPTGAGTALWFSWIPVMNAAVSKEYGLFRQLLTNAGPYTVHEKVYPSAWTLLHALTDLGDLGAIQELFNIAGNSPLGFTLDSHLRTPLDIGFDSVHKGILDYLLSKAKSWPAHVLEFNTVSICKLIPMSLSSMPDFLDSRLAEPLPDGGDPPPTETLIDAANSISTGLDYFEAIGKGGSVVPALSLEEYKKFGMAIQDESDLQKQMEFKGDDDSDPTDVFDKLKSLVSSHAWMLMLTVAVLADFISTLLTFVSDIKEDDKNMKIVVWAILVVFLMDIVLRIVAYRMEFFFGKHRYMNVFELTISVGCVIMEVSESDLPVSIGRLLRPIIRSFRFFTRMLAMSLSARRLNVKGSMPILVRSVYLNGVMDHKDGILRELVNSKQAALFRSTTVRAILEFKWSMYARSSHLRNFAIYILYAACWTTYSAITYQKNAHRIDRVYKDFLAVILLCLSGRYTMFEVIKFWTSGFLEWSTNGWNLLSGVSNIALAVLIILEASGGHQASTESRNLAAATTPFIWMQCFHYLRGFRGTGALVRMMFQIISDIRHFLLIMVVMTVAFTQAFFILKDPDIPVIDEPWEIAWQVYNTAWLGSQWTWYFGPALQRCLYLFMTFFMLVVLMNLLIAIMGDTFARVQEVATVEFYRSFAQLIFELEVLMTPKERRNTAHFPKYILFTQPDTHETLGVSDEENHEESPASASNDVNAMIEQLRAELEALQRKTSKIADDVRDATKVTSAPRHEFHV